MPGPLPTPVASDPSPPARADVVVVGGGIVGACAALELAERGLSVVLCEKGEIGAEQSSRNWGWVRLARRDPREIALMIEAQRAWEGMDARVGRATGYTRTGLLFAAKTGRREAQYERWAKNLAPHQIECRVIRGGELERLLPGRHKPLRAALYTPGDGRAEPQWAAPAIAEGARAAGAAIMTRCAVRRLDIAGGRVAGVATERGRIACDAVILAGGAWSRLFSGVEGVELPQLKVLNTVLRTTAVKGGPETGLWDERFAMRKRADGGYTLACGTENTHDLVPDSVRLARAFWPAFRAEWQSLRFRVSDRWGIEAAVPHRWEAGERSPFEECRVLDPAPKQKVLRRVWAAARRAFPVLEGAEVAQSWAGMIDVTPDAIPVISAVDAVPGFFIATGFSGHGFGIAPGAGRLVADLATGAAPVVDPHDFRLSRFTDGSPVRSLSGF